MKSRKQAQREAAQMYRLCLTKGVLDEERARRVVRRIATARPRGYTITLSHFRRLIALDRARHTAKVQSARRLPPDIQTKVQAGLVEDYGQGLKTTFAENPALIGGMRIQVGSDVYDGTVQSRLAALEQNFNHQ
jgi:F-type H+-transporting ATPase subunit delta